MNHSFKDNVTAFYQSPSSLPLQVRSLGYGKVTSKNYYWDRERHLQQLSPEKASIIRNGKGSKADHMFTLQCTLSGAGIFQDEHGHEHTLDEHAIFIAGSDREYAYHLGPHANWSYVWIALEGSVAHDLLTPIRDNKGSCLQGSDLKPFIDLMCSMVDGLHQRQECNPYRLSSAAYDYLLRLNEHYCPTPIDKSEQFRFRADHYIRTHLRSVTAETLAEHFGYHPKYFINLCKEMTGLTPRVYIEKNILAQAETLLTHSNKSLREISSHCQYSSENYFSACFKKKYGLTPSKYRKMLTKPIEKTT